MPFGASAMPPVGYVAFCQRKPLDCGADPEIVLASARRAQQERDDLLAALGPRRTLAIEPAALSAPPAPQEPRFETPPRLARAASPTEAMANPAGAVAPMTPGLWSTLHRVNAKVNRTIIEQLDRQTYGADDYWNTPLEDGLKVGDCEDYVLEKERSLIASGLPRNALNIALVNTAWGESHAVLLVATSEGEYVLDNLSPWIVRWHETSYRWVRRQVNGEPFHWVMVGAPEKPKAEEPKDLLIASIR